MKSKNYLFYMPGLDGLRAISVIAIIIYHLNPAILPGGFLGVDTFFIISGFLITTLLLKEHRETGTIRLTIFYMKRIRRLFPAVLLMIVTVFNYCLFFQPALIEQLRKDIVAVLLYVTNWWYIYDTVDYFQSFNPKPLQHLWSLAIEEQFYFVFPCMLLLFLTLNKRKLTLFYFALLAVCSGLWMNYLYEPGMNTSRLYFGTDTRLQTLMLGVLLAFIWPVHQLKAKPGVMTRTIMSILGFTALFTLMGAFVVVRDSSGYLYQGGFGVLGIITLVIIASCVFPGSLLNQLLSWKLLTTIGRYSYSLYLWHYPVIVLTHAHFNKGELPSYIYGIDIALTIGLAVLSYHLVEQPFRKGVSLKTAPVALALAAVTLFTGYKYVDYHAPIQEARMTSTASILPEPKPLAKLHPGTTAEQQLAPLFIGDSLLVDIYYALKEEYPDAEIDGKVGRNIYQAIPLAAEYQSFNHPARKVVLHVGTNGDFTKEHLDKLLSYFDKADVFLVTTKVPLDYEAHVNQLMKEAAESHRHVHVIDWYTASVNHPEYFASDGIHLEAPGVEAMKNLIKQALTAE
ncbi:acyltransferase family protein [Macrococcus equipercicus]|uniref:Acetyltransferase n=1 Tax=Macrococcus equipercicus TaxID=69967 RepID=A0A9Q9BUM8_9STAP|nr:acyltransferase family protein [Macrococcus equipercicus]UTH13253.1 acetyltransferase [Macrococcus equipercicus]